jgi:hypothetical protein
MNRLLIGLIVVLLACANCFASDPNDSLQFTSWITGSDDALHIRIGLSESIASWGVSGFLFPGADETETTYAIGAWAALATPDVTVIPVDSLPIGWLGLKLQAFADVDVAYDFPTSRVLVLPGVGIRAEPAKTASLIARWYYPLGEDRDPDTVDLNSFGFEMGLAIQID